MTARQFVLSKYPDAHLDFRFRNRFHCLGGYWLVMTNKGSIGRAVTSRKAWNEAKKFIQQKIGNPTE